MITRFLTILSLSTFFLIAGGQVEAGTKKTVDGKQLFHPPKSTRKTEITQLAYLHSSDGIDGKDYAYLVYKEEDRKSGEWEIKAEIKDRRISKIDPEANVFRSRMSQAAVAGKNYFLIGYSITPTPEDARRVENRVYFNKSLQPEYLQIHLVTRNSDGSPKAEKVAKIDWPADPNGDEKKKLLSLPRSNSRTEITELAYINSYDVIANDDYAYLAYKKTNRRTGEWELKIKAKATASSKIDPNDRSLRRDILAAASEGKKYLVTGFRMTPEDDDKRLVENRIYFDKSHKPKYVEIHVVTRNADGSPKKRKVVKFDWPS